MSSLPPPRHLLHRRTLDPLSVGQVSIGDGGGDDDDVSLVFNVYVIWML